MPPGRSRASPCLARTRHPVIVEKLTAYHLDLDHEVGRPRAQGFPRALGIGIDDVGQLADQLRDGLGSAHVSDVRDDAPFGVLCEVPIPVRGLRSRADRKIEVTASWELRETGGPPRPITACIDGRPAGTVATVRRAISEHDVVVLREPVGAWPPGTTARARPCAA